MGTTRNWADTAIRKNGCFTSCFTVKVGLRLFRPLTRGTKSTLLYVADITNISGSRALKFLTASTTSSLLVSEDCNQDHVFNMGSPHVLQTPP